MKNSTASKILFQSCWTYWAGAIGGALLTFYPTATLAQIAGDGSLGTQVNGSTIAPCVGVCTITNGATRGSNLFHSFRQFSLLNPADSANFQTAPAIQNVIVRVTGVGQPFISNINGLIQTSNPANFFLLNPNGIIFGPGAALNIGGSFLATTADRIQFQDGTQFSTTDPAPLLTVSVPVGLQLGTPQGSIQLQGSVLLAGIVDSFGDITLIGNAVSLNNSEIQTLGNDGNIKIQAHSLRLENSSVLKTTPLGQGQSGNINLQVDGDLAILDSHISSELEFGQTGAGGNIQIQAASLSMRSYTSLSGGQAFITTASSGFGNAGNITIQVKDAALLDNSFISSNLNFNAIGQGGNITLEAGSVSLKTEAFINNNTFGTGDSGKITVRARGAISLTNSSSLSSGVEGLASGSFQDAIGKGGTIRVEAQSLDLTQGSQLKTSTAGQGKAGDIQVITANSILIDGMDQFGNASGFLSSSVSSAGGAGGQVQVETDLLRVTGSAAINASTSSNFEGGQIIVNARNLELASGGRLLTTTAGLGQAGNITIHAPDLQLEGSASGVFAQTTSQGAAGNLLLQPNVGGDSLSIRVQDGAQISASSLSAGQGGSLLVIAPRLIALSGNGALSAGTRGSGAGGSLQLSTQQLSIQDGINLTASTFGSGKAGNIAINADVFTLSRNATVSTSTFASGQAGDLTVQVSDRLTLSGKDTGLFANTAPGSSGNGGNILIDPQTVSIRDGASIAVDSQGRGTGGNIQIQAGTLTLDTQGVISAQTASNQGGNIALNVQDLLLLRHNSLISTTAGTAQAGGDGGNVTLNAKFIVAVLSENSDITANAFTGNGGKVNVTAQGIYGLKFQPQLTPFSDITATSQFGVNGTVTLNVLNVDPSRGLVALPTDLTDPSQQISQDCTARSKTSASSFVTTGRGGIPLSPEEPLESRAVVTRWVPLPEDSGAIERSGAAGAVRAKQSQSPKPQVNMPSPLVEAQGWIVRADGAVELVSHVSNGDRASFWTSSVPCQTSQGN